MAATEQYLKSLMTAALALPGIAAGASVIDDVPVTYKHLSYEENDLMSVEADYFDFGIPIDGKNDLQVSLELETMSGASPVFMLPGPGDEVIQVTSGASITDERTALAVNYRHFFDNGMLSVAPAGSSENDYDSISLTMEYQWDRNGKNTTYSVGVGYTDDRIGATGQDLNEEKVGNSWFAGLTQVLSAQSLLQLNLSVAEESGYLSDPYKLALVETNFVADSRPPARRQSALLLRYISYEKNNQASLHLGYRYFADDWGIEAHTLETAWNQELPGNWLASYSLRYYTQGKADFYAPFYTASRADGFYSSDYRLAGNGSALIGLKLEKTFTTETSVNLNVEYYTRRGDLKLDGVASTDPEPLESYIVLFGIGHRF